MAATKKAAGAPARRKATAAKVAPPAAQTAAADTPAGAAPRAAAARRVPTRTAVDGSTARTSRASRARTAAATTIEPTEVLAAPGAPAPEPEPDDDGQAAETDVIWRDRTIRVRPPTLEQLTIYRRLARKFHLLSEQNSKPDAEPMSLEEATGHYDRAIKLVTSVMVHPADVEWLEDEMLEGRIRLPDAADLMQKAIGALADANTDAQPNRAARRKARLGD
jgi:hypothetical protein